jgi:hypothetical protein
MARARSLGVPCCNQSGSPPLTSCVRAHWKPTLVAVLSVVVSVCLVSLVCCVFLPVYLVSLVCCVLCIVGVCVYVSSGLPRLSCLTCLSRLFLLPVSGDLGSYCVFRLAGARAHTVSLVVSRESRVAHSVRAHQFCSLACLFKQTTRSIMLCYCCCYCCC